MSVKSWLREFYPTEATDNMTNLQAVRHSLQKWRGLTEENLKRHHVDTKATNGWRSGRAVTGRSNGGLQINDSSCALCQKHSYSDNCRSCPIVRATGHRCDKRRYDRAADVWSSPWSEFQDTTNPAPMIAVLERTETHLLKDLSRKR